MTDTAASWMHDQSDRDFSAIWCDSCRADVTHLFAADHTIATWADDGKNDTIPCRRCGELAVHQHCFDV
jgi:hypothetical protein